MPDAENILSQIAEIDVVSNVLTIPQHVRHDRLGGTAAIMQAIATWSNCAQGGIVRTYIETRDGAREEMIGKLVSTHHGLMAILLAEKVLAKDGSDITDESRRAALRVLAAKSEHITPQGMKETLFVAVDHTSYDRPRAFYRSGPSRTAEGILKTEAELRPLIGSLLRFGQLSGRRAHLDAASDAMAGVLFELFENTHKHGAKAADGSARLKRSVRGLRVEWVAGEVPALLGRAHGDNVLSRYIANERHGSSRGETVRSLANYQRFLEFSIFDTGPGLAAPLLHSEGLLHGNFNQEFLAARKALRKNTSSLPSSSRGIGLHRVQELLTKLHGYMRIRSGRVELARDFIMCPYLSEVEKDHHWIEGGRPVEKPFAAGTLMTMLIPVDLEGREN